MSNILTTITNNGFFDTDETKAFDSAILAVNRDIVSPFALTGELIIDYRLESDLAYTCAYHAVLTDGPGKSCAATKINTLIAHPEIDCTGHLALADLGEGEVRWYGSNRLRCKVASDTLPKPYEVSMPKHSPVEFLIAFSDRKEWQDELYVAAIRRVLMHFTLGRFTLRSIDALSTDPVVGTARNVVSFLTI